MFAQMTKAMSLVVMMACAAAGMDLPAPAWGMTGEQRPQVSGRTLKTKDLGELGDLDQFLTGVVPDWPGWSRRYWTDKELWGNQGYIVGGPRKKMEGEGALRAGASEGLAAITATPGIPEAPVEKMDLDVLREKPGYHTVVKGECLWYIAGYDHIYGNPLQWPLIYKANKDKIKNPDLIYPGQVFLIPRN